MYGSSTRQVDRKMSTSGAEEGASTKKLIVSTYLQYIFIAFGALLLFVFVRQLGGVLLTFLLAAVLAYALNPVVRMLEGWRSPGSRRC